MENNVSFLRCQIFKRYICTYAHFPGNVLHQGPHQRLPRRDRPFINGQRFIRYQRRFIHSTDNTGTVTSFAGSLTVEGQLFRSRREERNTADRAYDGPFRSHVHGWFRIMAVGTAVAGKSRKHKTQDIQKFRSRSECTADAGNAGPLAQRQGRRHIQDLVDLGLLSLGHTASCISGQGFQIAPGPLGI